MSNLRTAELVKYPERIAVFIEKVRTGSPFLRNDTGRKQSFNSIVCKLKTGREVEFDVSRDSGAAEFAKALQSLRIQSGWLVDGKGERVPFSKLEKTDEFGGVSRGNKGDMAEAIFAAAIAARFLNKKRRITPAEVNAMIDTLSVRERQVVTRFGDNRDSKLKDTINLQVNLARSNISALLDRSTRATVSTLIDGSVNYANSSRVMAFAEMIYNNGLEDVVDVIADGTGNQTGTKVDVYVVINGAKVDINVSLKAGEVKQVGQVYGSTFGAQKRLWDTLLGVDVSSVEDGFEKRRTKREFIGAMELTYKKAADEYNALLRADRGNAYKKLSSGILYFSTLNEDDVKLVQLTKGRALEYDMTKLYDAMMSTSIQIRAYFDRSKTYHEVKFKTTRGQTLLTVRVRIESKDIGAPVVRNYVEKGPLMTDLIATEISAVDKEAVMS